MFNSFSSYLQDKIKLSPEWAEWSGVPSSKVNEEFAPTTTGRDLDDLESDIPF